MIKTTKKDLPIIIEAIEKAIKQLRHFLHYLQKNGHIPLIYAALDLGWP